MRKYFVNWAGLAFVLFGIVILFVLSACGTQGFPWEETIKEFAIALIGAGAVTLILRISIDNQLEEMTNETIKSITDRHLDDFKETIRMEIRRRTDFDPAATFVARSKSEDVVEQYIRKSLPDAQMYTSFGVSGQYALKRIIDLNSISLTCSIKIIMADPNQLNERVFADVDALKKRISACTQLLVRESEKKSLGIEIFFSNPIPSLRFDILGTETYIYAFDDQHRPEGSLPDAARFVLGTQWDRSSRQMALDAERAARAGWRRGDGAWIASETNRPTPLSPEKSAQDQIKDLLERLGLQVLDEQSLKTMAEGFPSFQSAS